MNRTKIEWAQNPDSTPGYTWNPITGCLNGCDYCYARMLANGRLESRMLANTDLAHHSSQPVVDHGGHHTDPFYPRFWPSRMQELLSRNTACIERHPSPRGIFVCSMSDLFGIGVPEEWTRQVLQAIGDNAYDRFYLLTKQPQNLAKWSPFPDNCWVGVSATNMTEYLKAIIGLRKVQAAVKYISFEPLLERLHYDDSGAGIFPEDLKDSAGINWVIIGAQTKPYIAPKVEWVREIVEAADSAGIPVFLKDSLKGEKVGGMIRVNNVGWLAGPLRQEMPGVDTT